MTKTELQSAVSKLARAYGVPPIKLDFTERRGAGLACYNTYRYKIGGKIQKQHHPKSITVFTWSSIKDHLGEVSYRVGHELAHHVANMKKNSLAHTSTFYNLEEKIARQMSKMLK